MNYMNLINIINWNLWSSRATTYYIQGLLVFLIGAGFGWWLIYRATIKYNAFYGGAITLPIWLLYCIGISMQILLIIYVYLGIQAGIFF